MCVCVCVEGGGEGWHQHVGERLAVEDRHHVRRRVQVRSHVRGGQTAHAVRMATTANCELCGPVFQHMGSRSCCYCRMLWQLGVATDGIADAAAVDGNKWRHDGKAAVKVLIIT